MTSPWATVQAKPASGMAAARPRSKLVLSRRLTRRMPVARCRYGCNHIALRVNWRRAIDLGSIGDGAGALGE
jgi:hypothetical protein